MVKVAILGVEGSGKTVLFSVMGDRYETPDRNGLFLTPSNHETYSYCKKGMAALRKGAWPPATTPDTYVDLVWDLMKKGWAGKRVLARLSFLDVAGEVYRKAFSGERLEVGSEVEWNAVKHLKSHVKEADVLIVLVDLSKIINGDESDARIIEMHWLTQAILRVVLINGDEEDGRTNERLIKTNWLSQAILRAARKKSVALVFTQADRYSETIKQCGGVRGALAKYLPVVDLNHGSELHLFAVAAVNKTVPSEENPAATLPERDFGSMGFEELMRWIVKAARRRSFLEQLASWCSYL